MLSFETPPPDPPCACEISQLKSSSECDERASNKIALQGVDLSQSGLGDKNPLPKFSIREYVFSARRKDIKTNWPFSLKNLQLCIKHGVKELLPPFQSIDSVGNKSVNSVTTETCLIDKENISNSEDGSSKCFVPMCLDDVRCEDELKLDSVNINLRKTNQSNSSEGSGEKFETVGPIASQKSEYTGQIPPIKKCRLIVKVGAGADPSSNEDNPEPMASKVCPVCRVFSSSSNTTLNAHIDQCLTVESTVKCDADSRVIKHRIKPRKTRLMVDIYATAKHCTLEELDRRNGTSWAMKLPTHETTECCAEEEMQRILPVTSKDNGGEGAVYIDANGKKVRILSKFNDKPQTPNLEADPKCLKPFRGRGCELPSTLKKRHQSRKHHKYLKLAPHGKKLCSSKLRHVSKVQGDLSRNFALKGSCEKLESLTRAVKAEESIKFNDLGAITKWACSKRSSRLKRCKNKKGLQQVGCQSSLGKAYSERSCVLATQHPSEHPLSSPESSKRMENSSFMDSSGRKKVGFSSIRSLVSGDENKFRELSKCNANKLKKKGKCFDTGSKDFADYRENWVCSPVKKPIEINACPIQNSSRDVYSNPTFSSKSTKLSSLKKHMLVQKSLPRKKSEVQAVAESKEKNTENNSKAEKITGKQSLRRGNLLKIRKKRVALSMGQEEQTSHLKSTLDRYCYEIDNNIDYSDRVDSDLEGAFDGVEYAERGIQAHGEETVTELPSGVDVDGNVLDLSKPTDPQFQCLSDQPEMLYVDEVGNSMTAENNHKAADMESSDGPANYSMGINTIVIPELAGSFLPSPKDMGFEDLQGNSSLAATRVESSEDHHDDVERDSSYSPISAISTLSNSTVARSDSKSSEGLSVGTHFTQDEIRSGTTPVSLESKTQAEAINLDEPKVVLEEGTHSSRNDHACRCSWKGATPLSVSLNYQESHLLRRRAMGIVPVPALGKQQNCNLDMRADGLNSLSAVSSLSCFPSSEVSTDSSGKPPMHGGCDSGSPSSSNPILRLMGKNLMIVKKDESGSSNATLSPQIQTLPGIPAHDIQSGDFNAFHHMLHKNPPIGSHVPLNSSHKPSCSLENMFSGKNVGGGFTAPMELCDNKVGYGFPNVQNGLRNSLYMPSLWYTKKVANSTINPVKEVIIIDDNPEEEAASYEGTKRMKVNSAGISSPIAVNYNSRDVNPFYSYYDQPLLPRTSFQLPPDSRVNGKPMKWNYASEGPSVLPPGSLLASSSSASHLRPSYYSPSLS